MPGIATSCPEFDPDCDCPKTGNPDFQKLNCDQLLICMNHAVNGVREGKSGVQGLKKRFDEQIHGPCGPDNGPDTWKKHDDQIKGNQDKLADYADRFEEKKCGEVPGEILDYATKPRPQREDWDPEAGKECEEAVAKAAAAAAAATAVAKPLLEAAIEAAAEAILELLPILAL